MSKDWDAVARVIDERMRLLEITQAELAVKAGVAPETVRELRNNLKPRRRNPRTLSAISVALGLPGDHLASVLAGREPGDPDADDPVLAELAELKEGFTELSRRLDAVERRLGADDV